MRDPLVIKWPTQTLPMQHVRLPVKERPTTSGPAPIAGRAQTVVSSAGGWRIQYKGVLVLQRNMLAFNALMARIEGRAEPIYVGPVNPEMNPVNRAGLTSPVLSTFSDGTIFTDGTRWETSIFGGQLSVGAARGDTTISLSNTTAPLAAGDYIELDGRLHVIESLSGLTTTDASSTILTLSGLRTFAASGLGAYATDSLIGRIIQFGWQNGPYGSADENAGLFAQIVSNSNVAGTQTIVIDRDMPSALSVADDFFVSSFSGAATIWPPLRATYASGSKIEIGDPRMIAYLKTKEVDPQIQRSYYGEVDLEFVEAGW